MLAYLACVSGYSLDFCSDTQVFLSRICYIRASEQKGNFGIQKISFSPQMKHHKLQVIPHCNQQSELSSCPSINVPLFQITYGEAEQSLAGASIISQKKEICSTEHSKCSTCSCQKCSYSAASIYCSLRERAASPSPLSVTRPLKTLNHHPVLSSDVYYQTEHSLNQTTDSFSGKQKKVAKALNDEH